MIAVAFHRKRGHHARKIFVEVSMDDAAWKRVLSPAKRAGQTPTMQVDLLHQSV